MWTRQRKKRRAGALIVPVIAVAFLSYFGFHAFQGEYGIYAKYRLQERTASLHAELAQVRKERERIEHRVRLLADGTLEKDMLEEQARRSLNLARADELIIFRVVRQQD
jgi:cell division protein FtsB